MKQKNNLLTRNVYMCSSSLLAFLVWWL